MQKAGRKQSQDIKILRPPHLSYSEIEQVFDHPNEEEKKHANKLKSDQPIDAEYGDEEDDDDEAGVDEDLDDDGDDDEGDDASGKKRKSKASSRKLWN